MFHEWGAGVILEDDIVCAADFARSRRVRLVMRLAAFAVVLALVLFVAFQLRIEHQYSSMNWHTEQGGIELQFVPGKKILWIIVEDDYEATTERTWNLSKPTGLWGRCRAGLVSSPEDLFQRAHVNVLLSSLAGVVRFYDVATETQRDQIVGTLNWMCRDDPAIVGRLKEIADDDPDEYGWLVRVLR